MNAVLPLIFRYGAPSLVTTLSAVPAYRVTVGAHDPPVHVLKFPRLRPAYSNMANTPMEVNRAFT
jgi:hypothetical protein